MIALAVGSDDRICLFSLITHEGNRCDPMSISMITCTCRLEHACKSRSLILKTLKSGWSENHGKNHGMLFVEAKFHGFCPAKKVVVFSNITLSP